MAEFKIAAAQVASVRGDIERNVTVHASATIVAAAHGVSLLVFPELSLTGYEPASARDLAITPSDCRLEPLVEVARRRHISVIVGAPLIQEGVKPALGALAIANDGTIHAYHKMHLGSEESNFFEAGDRPLVLAVQGHKVGVAICADSKAPGHPERYAESGAEIYAASVFLNAEWYETDMPPLAECAARNSMLTVMANHADSVGSYTSVGKSAIWGLGDGVLVQAAGTENALLMASKANRVWSGKIVQL